MTLRIVQKALYLELAGRLRQLIVDRRKVLRLSRQRPLHLPGRRQPSPGECPAVFAAVKAGDAERVMREHLLNQRAALATIAGLAAAPLRRRARAGAR